MIPGIGLRNGSKQRSWYYPGHSTLVLVGIQEILDQVNLDYDVPAGTEPTGCRKWTQDD